MELNRAMDDLVNHKPYQNLTRENWKKIMMPLLDGFLIIETLFIGSNY